MNNTLLTRQEFKKLGFEKTNGKCCIPGCNREAVDAHHILDRKLWSDGGYYLSNCAPVCSEHHCDCEQNVYRPIQLIRWCNIDLKDIKKPDRLDWIFDKEYIDYLEKDMIDKWGN